MFPAKGGQKKERKKKSQLPECHLDTFYQLLHLYRALTIFNNYDNTKEEPNAGVQFSNML